MPDVKEKHLENKKSYFFGVFPIEKPKDNSAIIFDNYEYKSKNALHKIVDIINKQILKSIEDRRLLISTPFVILFGLIIYTIPKNEPSSLAMIILGFLLIIYLLYSFLRGDDIRKKSLFLLLFIGFALLPIHGAFFGTKMLDRPFYAQTQAVVEKVLSNKDDGQRVIISSIVISDNKINIDIKKARLFIKEGAVLSEGDLISAPIRFTSVPSPVVVGGYDSQFQSYFSGIGAYATSTKPPKIIGKEKGISISTWTKKLRLSIGKRIDELLPSQSSSIAKALIVGDQSGILPEIRQIMSASGLAHVLAISGLHLSLVAGGVFALSRLFLSISYSLAQRLNTKKIAAIAGVVTAVFYLAISGASVSAVRATIMLVLIFGAVIVGRRALTMRNVAFAAIFVIITDPSSVFRPSFQLSFAAVVALVGVYETYRFNDTQRNFAKKIFNFFAGLASTSLIAGIATALFAAYHFQQTAPLGVLANLAALPLVAFIVLPAGFIAVLLMPFGFEEPFLILMGIAIDKIIDIALVISNLSEGMNYSPVLMPISLVFGLLALLWLAFFTNKFRFVGVALAIPLIAFFGISKNPDILIADGSKAVAINVDIEAKDDRANAELAGRLKINDNEAMALISGRVNSFVVNAWQKTYQQEIGQKLKGNICDKSGCIYESSKGYKLALVKSKQAFYEDCYIADIIITRLYAPDFCRSLTAVIDQSDLNKNGMHWLRWDIEKENFIIRTAIKDINRPWRP